jgi:hypothetical protein
MEKAQGGGDLSQSMPQQETKGPSSGQKRKAGGASGRGNNLHDTPSKKIKAMGNGGVGRNMSNVGIANGEDDDGDDDG